MLWEWNPMEIMLTVMCDEHVEIASAEKDDDLRAIGHIMATNWPGFVTVAGVVKEIKRLRRERQVLPLLAWLRDKPVASAIAARQDDLGEIYGGIHVLPDYRHLYIGSVLLAAALDDLAEQGAKTVFIKREIGDEVTVDDQSAAAFYAHAGGEWVEARRAADYVQTHGTAIERARLASVLRDEPPPHAVIAEITRLQNPDGGFPFKMKRSQPSTICDTSVGLMWLDDLGLGQSDLAHRARDYLVSTQRDDGSWDEAPAIAALKPPEWMAPGDPKTIVVSTAYGGHWLSGHRSEAASRAVDFLLAHRDKQGKLEGYLHSTWIAVVGFARLLGPNAKPVRDCLKVLASRLSPDWEGSMLSWQLRCFTDAGLGLDAPYVGRALAELLKRQRPDGSWASEDGDTYSVSTTIEALRVLRWYGLLTKKLEEYAPLAKRRVRRHIPSP
jgi:ribosomal protein S18 acetylase RimI-like enzyme